MNSAFAEAVSILTKKLEGWWASGIELIPNLLIAALVLLVFFLLRRVAKRMSARLLDRFTDNQAAKRLLVILIGLVVTLLGLFLSLSILGLEKAVTSILAGAGVLGIVIGFAFQEISANFLSGMIIAFRQPYRLDDIVEVKNYRGVVVHIDLRATMLRTFEGLDVLLPNKYFLTEPVVNLTHTADRRFEIRVGVSYAEDLDQVKRVLEGVLDDIPDILQDHPKEAYVYEFGSSSINFVVRAWIEYPGNANYFRVPDLVARHIKRAFDRHGITIPFPIRTLDFGIKGGVELRSELKGLDRVGP